VPEEKLAYLAQGQGQVAADNIAALIAAASSAAGGGGSGGGASSGGVGDGGKAAGAAAARLGVWRPGAGLPGKVMIVSLGRRCGLPGGRGGRRVGDSAWRPCCPAAAVSALP
jgi:hypothetical protein